MLKKYKFIVDIQIHDKYDINNKPIFVIKLKRTWELH